MPKYIRTKMCSECPFRAAAPRGWLGGVLTVDDLEATIHGREVVPGSGLRAGGEIGVLICHKEIATMLNHGHDAATIIEHGQQCVGSIRYANAVCKRSRIPQLEAYQDRLAETPDVPVIPPFELRRHHTLESQPDDSNNRKATRHRKTARRRKTQARPNDDGRA